MASLPIELPNLEHELQTLLVQIPRGCVTTYGDLAFALGTKAASRWVGKYLVDHSHSEECPCHRVVRANGELGRFFADDQNEKAERLQDEGVDVKEGRVPLSAFLFNEFETSFPVRALIDFQVGIPQRIQINSLHESPRLIAGVDLSYINPNEAVAAYILYDRIKQEVAYSRVLREIVPFPYIPGLLTFRELPLLMSLLDAVEQEGQLAELILVDGNGMLHPRRAGIATTLGVLTNCCTVGVAKSLLCGRVSSETPDGEQMRQVVDEEELIGVSLGSKGRSKPIYISVGNRIDLESGVNTVRQCLHGHRLPEPVFQADRLSRASATAEKRDCE